MLSNKIENQETSLQNLQAKLEKLQKKEDELDLQITHYEKKEEASIELIAKNRYELVAPPNALYSDKVICAFLYCPICATVNGGEFSTIEEAREHVKKDPLHLRLLNYGGKKFTDRLKCSRCRVCGEDIFGGNEIISHLLSDTHRFNFVALHDGNKPSILNQQLQNITAHDLESQLVDQIREIYKEMKATQKQMIEDDLSKKLNNKRISTAQEVSAVSLPKKAKNEVNEVNGTDADVVDLTGTVKSKDNFDRKPTKTIKSTIG